MLTEQNRNRVRRAGSVAATTTAASANRSSATAWTIVATIRTSQKPTAVWRVRAKLASGDVRTTRREWLELTQWAKKPGTAVMRTWVSSLSTEAAACP